MKLELKHLAPYLPYGLKMQVKHSSLEYSVMTLCDKTGLSNIGISDVIDDIECFKPILRPLSDLTKEITVNGKTFTPILEIAKEYDIIPNGEDVVFEDDKIKSFELLENIEDRSQPIDNEIVFLFDISKSINSENYNYQKVWEDKIGSVLNNNIQPFDYQEMCLLFEWHFDVFGLIPKGLAIDINTL